MLNDTLQYLKLSFRALTGAFLLLLHKIKQ